MRCRGDEAQSVTKDATIPVAARLIARSHLKRLPVVDEDGRPVGLVGRGDPLKVHLRTSLPGPRAGGRRRARRRHRIGSRGRQGGSHRPHARMRGRPT
ncbi:CBS domain-containing protein [Streptomyces sp. NBC_01006]|uniref:CBS domain-containing protein n=1 Tax=Streptomyces sp. NBC_01006 TaxID=2903716 RepID=UPI003869C43F|nr:CBS domain-containing protein [Streptomyces sp. NBC_01006]